MNILGIYRRERVARVSEKTVYLDSPSVDVHSYTLFETTYLGFLHKRTYRYRTTQTYVPHRSARDRDLFLKVVLPWLKFDDRPLNEHLASSHFFDGKNADEVAAT